MPKRKIKQPSKPAFDHEPIFKAVKEEMRIDPLAPWNKSTPIAERPEYKEVAINDPAPTQKNHQGDAQPRKR